MAQDTLRGRFIWHELMTTDTGAAAGFYKKIVGWKTQPWPGGDDYTIFLAGKQQAAGLMTLPAEAKQGGAPPNWISYIGTGDTDKTASRLEKLGGKVLRAPWNIPTVGRVAIVQDAQGAVFGLYTPDQRMPVGAQPAVGEFSWHELMVDDQAAALAFYRDLFGWKKTSSMDMGPETGRYDMFGLSGDVPMGGVMKRPPNVPANWLPYAMVPDSKKAAKMIASLGATILHGPMEVPGGDWIVVGTDPQGAVFAVHSVKPVAAATPAKKAAKPAAQKAVAKKKTVAKKKAAPRKVTKAAKKATARSGKAARKGTGKTTRRVAARRKRSARR